MSPVASKSPLTPIPASPLTTQLTAIAKATSALEAKSHADALCLAINPKKTIPAISPAQSFVDAQIPSIIMAWAASSNPSEREGAGVLTDRLAKSFGEGCEGLLLPLVPTLLGVLMDKTQSIRTAAQSAVNSIVKLAAPEGMRQILAMLQEVLNENKGWRTKVGTLKAMEAAVRPGSEEWVALELSHIIPAVEAAMHDTKTEVSVWHRFQGEGGGGE